MEAKLARGRCYSIAGLLELRASLPIVTCPIEKVNRHVDIVSIFRIPDEAFNNHTRFSCSTKALANVNNNHRNLLQSSRRHLIESSEESEDRMSSSMNSLRDSRQYQWSFRRRESSDRSSQPHSAPTGITAQQSENFQRFYRAVVSPTHLRVTAGGRIVPNTRSNAVTLPPPQLDWSNDKLLFDHRRPTAESAGTVGLAAQMPVRYSTPTANALTSPYSLVTHTGSFANMMSPTQPGIEDKSATAGSELVLAPDTSHVIGVNTFPRVAPTQAVKISPPSQFDQSKPYMINGQIVYPVPQSFQPSPMPLPLATTMMANSSFIPQPQVLNGGGYISAQFPGLMPGLPGVPGHCLFPAQQVPVMMSNLLPAEMMAPMVSYLPVRGVPVQPEATRLHIHHLHSQIKLLDHQLLHNRHQIDEHATEAQRAILVGQIRNLELVLEYQAAQEAMATGGYQMMDESHESREVVLMPPVAYSTKSGNDGTAVPLTAPQKQDTEKQMLPRHAEVAKVSAETMTASAQEPVVKSKLSIKAPAFQPRSHVLSQEVALVSQRDSISGAHGADTLDMADEDPETQAQIEARLASRATGNYGSRNSSIITISPAALPRAYTQYDHATMSQFTYHTPSTQRSSAFNSSEGGVSSTAVPYLVGSLPHGIHSSLAKSTDFSYSRPLTDEEVRARHLYWGKAPHSIQRGLPKFDGKDFYPPSPTKANARMITARNSTSSSTGRDDYVYSAREVATFFTEPSVRGSKHSSPSQSFHAGRNEPSVSHSEYSVRHNGQRVHRSQHSSFAEDGNSVTDVRAANGMMGKGSPSGLESNEVALDDFSNLFNEPGVPGYISPTPKKIGDKAPIAPTTLKSVRGVSGDAAPKKLWQSNDPDYQRISSESDTVVSTFSTKEDARSSRSSAEFHPSPQKILSPRSAHEKAFVERVENFRSSEVQHVFLQNMLKNVSHSGSVLSGAITPTTAQGFLPQFRGSAAASLTPTMMSHVMADRDFCGDQTSLDGMKDSNQATVAFTTADVLAENCPPGRGHPQASDNKDDSEAQGYMRYLAQKDDNKKKMFEQGVGAETASTLTNQRFGW